MQRRSLDDLFRDPFNAYATEPGWLVYFQPAFSACAMWGVIDGATVAKLDQVAAFRHTRAPHASLLDMRFVTSLDASAFETRKHLMKTAWSKLEQTCTRLAMLRPDGFLGATMEGIRVVAPGPFPERFFTDPDHAIAWLGSEYGADYAQFEGIRFEICARDASLRALRALLETNLALTLTEAARRLAMSERSLQRRLEARGTSYLRELASARVRRAQQLLATTAASVSEVAFDVGCSSPQHLGKLFRKLVRATPTQWRERRTA